MPDERTSIDRSEGGREPAAAQGTTRREALQLCAAAAAAGLGWPQPGPENAGTRQSASGAAADGYDALDIALGMLQRAEPDSKQGLSTHAPMVAEALCALGHGERAPGWVARYRAPLLRLPEPREPIRPEHWRSALGARLHAPSWEAALERWGDWKELFTAELAEAPWREVVDTWASRLAPGLCSAATHGVIRTAHAARGLARRESVERRGELARALAYWAAAYQELPARESGGQTAASYQQALERLPLYWDEHGQAPGGNIVNGLRQAGALPGFSAARDLLAMPDDVPAALSALTATFARAYLRHGTQPRSIATIAFVHAVTAPSALRRLLPYLRPETSRGALPYAWQAAAGIYAAYARRGDAGREPEPTLTRAELAARAVENGDEHAIKFTEALLGEHALNPDPVYLAAAQDALARL